MIILSSLGDNYLIRSAHPDTIIDRETFASQCGICGERIGHIGGGGVADIKNVGRDALANLREHLVHDLLVHPSNLSCHIPIGVHRVVDVDVAHEGHNVAGVLPINGKTSLILELIPEHRLDAFQVGLLKESSVQGSSGLVHGSDHTRSHVRGRDGVLINAIQWGQVNHTITC
jgi:hypothetical protein